MKHHMGWIPDKPDQRDHLYAAHWSDIAKLPSIVDWRAKCPSIDDQGQLGSCGPHAGVAAMEFDMAKQGEQPLKLSRLFLYYVVRSAMGTVNTDSGVSIRDLIKAINVYGVCPETECPYDISKFTVKPSAQCYRDALLHQSVSYQRVPQSLPQIKSVLASGYTIVFGFSVYESFESEDVAQTGIVPMPQPSESLLGGHAVMLVGYHDAEQMFIVRNSWGTNWGQSGYFMMPYSYVISRSLASDFWTIRKVE